MLSSRTFILRLAILGLCALTSAACKKAATTKSEGGYELLELRYESFPGRVFPTELAEDLGYLAPLKLKSVGTSFSGPANIQNVATGEIDFGGAFNGAVIKLIAAHAPVRAVLAFYGTDGKRRTDFFASDDSPIKSAGDLLGKKIAVNTLGAHSEFTIREYLSRHGITGEHAKQVTMVVLPPANSEQALRQHQVDATALDDVLRDKALERGGLRLLFSDYDLFGAFNAGSYVLRTSFIEQHPNTVRKLVQATAKAIEWSKHTPREEVIARMKKIIQKRGRNEDLSSVDYWQSFGVVSASGVLASEDFQRWIDWLVKLGELAPGQVDLAKLYTNEFQAKPGS